MQGKEPKKPGVKPKLPPEALAAQNRKRRAMAILTGVVILLAISLTLIIDAISIYVGYEDESGILFSVGSRGITYFEFLMFLFFVILISVVLVFSREMAHAIKEDREKKAPMGPAKPKKPRRTLFTHEEKPEFRRSFRS